MVLRGPQRQGRETSHPPAEGNGEGSLWGSLFPSFFYESLKKPVPQARHCHHGSEHSSPTQDPPSLCRQEEEGASERATVGRKDRCPPSRNNLGGGRRQEGNHGGAKLCAGWVPLSSSPLLALTAPSPHTIKTVPPDRTPAEINHGSGCRRKVELVGCYSSGQGGTHSAWGAW